MGMALVAFGYILCFAGSCTALIALEDRHAAGPAAIYLAVGILLIKANQKRGARPAPDAGLLECPSCAGGVQPGAKTCPHCKRELKPAD